MTAAGHAVSHGSAPCTTRLPPRLWCRRERAGGLAYLSDQAPAGAGRGTGREASVTVLATSPALPYANALGELVWSHLAPHRDVAIIADADIGRWWDIVSDGDPAALDYGSRRPVRVAATLVEASPALMITTDHRGIATASLPAGNYLLCAVNPIGRPDDRQLACTYRHIAHTHDNLLHTWCCDAESGEGGIEALDAAQGRTLLDAEPGTSRQDETAACQPPGWPPPTWPTRAPPTAAQAPEPSAIAEPAARRRRFGGTARRQL